MSRGATAFRYALYAIVAIAAVVVFVMLYLGITPRTILDVIGVGRSFNQKPFENVVKSIAAGTLKPDANGVVALPATSADLTADGCVYVTPLPNGPAYLFISWRGKGQNMRGFLCAPASLAVPGSLNLSLPSPQMTPGDPPVTTTNVSIDRAILGPWYEVSFLLD